MPTDKKALKRALQMVEAQTHASLHTCLQALNDAHGDVKRAVQLITQQRAVAVAERTGVAVAESLKAVRKARGDVDLAVWYLQADNKIPAPADSNAVSYNDAGILARVQLVLSGYKKVETLKTPEELHLFADNYNWDSGERALIHVINQPYCDRGTALLVYWRAGPRWLYQYARRDAVPGSARKSYDLVKEIEAKYLAGFYTHQHIRFDPHNDAGDALTNSYSEIEMKQIIPELMYIASPGNELPKSPQKARLES